MKSSMLLNIYISSALLLNSMLVAAFAPRLAFTRHLISSASSSSSFSTISVGQEHVQPIVRVRVRPLHESSTVIEVLGGDDEDDEELEDEDEEQDDEAEDPYTQLASSEFQTSDDDDDDDDDDKSSALATTSSSSSRDEFDTNMDWGGALGKLRDRVDDVESGKSQDPSYALFRMMSSQTPNQIIGQFVSSANPQVVQAMSGAVGSLLGGLSNPRTGVETQIKASGEKIGSLCFQLQMTGYMFRNAEYVLALKDLMNLNGKASWQDYKDAFDRLDIDGSGYIEATEIQKLFDDVYEEEAPSFEIAAFLEFFDQNKDGRITWEEFESGLGAAMTTSMEKGGSAMLLLQGEDYDDDDDEIIDVNPNVSGTIEIELENGKTVEVEAKEYIESLKAEAQALKDALQREKVGTVPGDGMNGDGLLGGGPGGGGLDIATYLASRQGDVKSLTEGVSPEIVETMKSLVNFVLEGGQSGKAKKELSDQEKAEMEMEIPGSALQQLALWQLVLGYKLREAEVTGDYLKLLQ